MINVWKVLIYQLMTNLNNLILSKYRFSTECEVYPALIVSTLSANFSTPLFYAGSGFIR